MQNRSTLALLLLSLGAALTCVPSDGPKPRVVPSLNGVPSPYNQLLVVPPSGFAVTVELTATGIPIDLSSLVVALVPWDGGSFVDLSPLMVPTAYGAAGLVPASMALATGNYTLTAIVRDTSGATGLGTLGFAVRNFVNQAPPIGSTQTIWYDFAADRDGNGQPDFPADLAVFGLGSSADPGLSAQVESLVIDALLARVGEAYYEADPLGLGWDPVLVDFSDSGPAGPTTTRICVAGAAPGQPSLVGSILIDRNNQNKASVECGSIPPTGIFPRGLKWFQGQADFNAVFAPLMPALGGTPVGQHPLDAVVLDPAFDPGQASPEALARYDAIFGAIEAFANALGTVVAHETGHALGLVEPGLPGGGLFGGTSGANLAHNVQADGTTVPPQPYLMNAGNTFTFSKLAGINGQPLPYLRPLNHAYLRDRVVQDPGVTALLLPPAISGISPLTIVNDYTVVTVTGSNFAATPAMHLVGSNGTFDLFAEKFVSSQQATGAVITDGVPPGLYLLQLVNPDGQATVNASLVVEVVP